MPGISLRNEVQAHSFGVLRAVEAGYELLLQGASALDAVEHAVTLLEDDETFDAGLGSFLTADGRVQLDALLMDGETLRAGAVACVERLKNPIQAARLVLERSPHVYFAGAGAEEFARAQGMALIENQSLVIDRERQRLQAAQARAKAGIPDQTFGGSQPRYGGRGRARLRRQPGGSYLHRGNAEQDARPGRRLVRDRLWRLR